MNEMPLPPCDSHSAITAYFAGRGSPFTDASLRVHLGGCVSCRRYYDRQVLLSTLDPKAPKAQERIARGLGLCAASRPRPLTSWMVAGGLVPAAVALLLLARPREAPPPKAADTAGTFTARGAVQDQAPAVWIYRVGRDGHVSLAEPTLGAEEELAFAYSNTARHPYLMIFGVDEHRHIYWYHPAWTAGAPPPASVGATAGAGPHELPEAVRHRTDGAELTIYTVLSQRRIGVATVENAVRGAASNHAVEGAVGGDGSVVLGRSFTVQR